MIRLQQLKLPLDYNDDTLKKAVSDKLRIPLKAVREVEMHKRSIDARKKPEIFYSAAVNIAADRENDIIRKAKNVQISVVKDKIYELPQVKQGSHQMKTRPIIVGSGPAGLFCGLLLARAGLSPIILERGANVDERTEAVEGFWNGDSLNTRTNVQFGEGGAGTFSDGKLNTMVKDTEGRGRFVLETFVAAGADPDILYVNKPHIGTDILRKVVKHMRNEIISLGGDVRFYSQVTDIDMDGGRIRSVTVNHTETISCEVLVLAIGHSARDTFEMLAEKSVDMHAKSFAVGVRIEHPQNMINLAQYGQEEHPLLPAADYKLTRKLNSGRGIYSFCMCPGGYVVNASSEEERIAVNGMSYRARDGHNANSAMIVTVTPDDFGYDGVLGGISFQRDLEHFAWKAGEGSVPVQLFGDFCRNQESTKLGDVVPAIKGAWKLTNLREALPSFIGDSLEEGIQAFERIIPGFSRYDALLDGVESRTSSPVRIERNELFESNIQGLYPCGEGAGYAGGITSAAMDGMKVAEAIIASQNF